MFLQRFKLFPKIKNNYGKNLLKFKVSKFGGHSHGGNHANTDSHDDQGHDDAHGHHEEVDNSHPKRFDRVGLSETLTPLERDKYIV